jgi:carbon starvation protein
LIPALVMIVTTLASLTYFLFVKYLPEGNVILAVTDIILLTLAVSVMALSLKQFLAFRGMSEPSAS